MVKINFQNNITKCNADTFNTMQDNIEDAIQENILLTNYVDNKLTYSTDEIVVGKWIDGKPLYRKVFQNVSITSSNSDLVDISGLGIQTVVKVYGIIDTSTSNHFPIPLTDSSSNYFVIFTTAGSIRGRAVVGSGTISNCWIAIEYTKTTD